MLGGNDGSGFVANWVKPRQPEQAKENLKRLKKCKDSN